MGNCYNYTPIPPAEASCIIAHLFVELALPCSCCKREDGVIVIQGKTYDGSSARKALTICVPSSPIIWKMPLWPGSSWTKPSGKMSV